MCEDKGGGGGLGKSKEGQLGKKKPTKLPITSSIELCPLSMLCLRLKLSGSNTKTTRTLLVVRIEFYLLSSPFCVKRRKKIPE